MERKGFGLGFRVLGLGIMLQGFCLVIGNTQLA